MMTREENTHRGAEQVENARKSFGWKTGGGQTTYETWGLDGRIILK
jgi:hypothetical protein